MLLLLVMRREEEEEEKRKRETELCVLCCVHFQRTDLKETVSSAVKKTTTQFYLRVDGETVVRVGLTRSPENTE